MKQKIVVSNVRFPYEEWMAVKAAASDMNMSINEYFRYLSNAEIIKKMTGIRKKTKKTTGYEALDNLLKFAKTHKGHPMGANNDDKAIYGIE
jgi:4-aminobutyrate aminotransferase-like enzyme